MKRIAIPYCRVSTADQAKNFSLTSQLEAIVKYCKYHNFEVGRVFIEEGESAKTVDRTQFQAMLDYVYEHENEVLAIVVYDTSRFSRNLRDRLNLEHQLKQCGVQILTVNDAPSKTVDEDPDRWLGKTINAVIDEVFLRKLRINVKRGMLKAYQEGYWPFKAPDGYTQSRDSSGRSVVQVDPTAAERIRTAFKLVAGGLSVREACVKLAESGWVGKGGKPLHHATLLHILKNPFYCGKMYVKNWGEPLTGRHQPIISSELFEKVKTVLQAPQAAFPFMVRKDEFPLRHFARCSKCGRDLTACWTMGRSKKYPYYKCTRCHDFYPAVDLEKKFALFLDECLTGDVDASIVSQPSKSWLTASYGLKRELQKTWFPGGVVVDDSGFAQENGGLFTDLPRSEVTVKKRV